MYETVIAYTLGASLAVVTCYPARQLEARAEQWFFTIIMCGVALGFVGLPLEHGDSHAAMNEVYAMIVMVVAIIASSLWHPVFLPIAFFLHGSWDLVYLIDMVHSVKLDWLVELCVPYDWMVAAYLSTRIHIWTANDT